MFDDGCYPVATMLIPKFKLHYLPECDRPVKKLVLIQAVSARDREKQCVLPEVEVTPTQPQPRLQHDTEGTHSDDLFAFITDETSLLSASTEHVVGEVDCYLSVLM